MKIRDYVTLITVFSLCYGWLMFIERRVNAQTRVNGIQQVGNLAPISAVQRAQCVGSGTTTNSNGATVSWNCAGLQLYKLTLVDGTVLGPYVAIPATAEQASLALWQTMSLNAPDPVVPDSLGHQ